MSYALFWIEILLASLLWVAVAYALATRLKRRVARIVILLIGLFVPGLNLIAATTMTALLKFIAGFETNWFAAALSLLVAYVIGAILILRRGRRSAPGFGASAAQWPLVRLATILLGTMAVESMTFWNMDLAALNGVAMMKVQAGTLMLAVTPPSVSDSQNAALLYDKAFARLTADPELTEGSAPELDADVHDPKVKALLDRHAATIKLLYEAAARPDCRFEHDYARPSISMLVPEVNGSTLASRLLLLNARRELADGQIGQAAHDIAISFRVGRDLGTDPWLVCTLVSIGMDASSIHTMEDLLPYVTRADELAGLRIGDAASFRRLIRRGMQGEEALGLGTMADVATGTLTPSDIMGRGPDHGVFNSARMFFRVFLLSDDVSAYRELMESRERAAAQPYAQARDQIQAVEQNIGGHGILTNVLAPAMSKAYLNSALGEARHACAQVALAATRYRLDHADRYPAKLEDLVPTYMDEAPIDPFNSDIKPIRAMPKNYDMLTYGRTLRMVPQGGDLLIYSIGPDGQDNAGAAYDTKSQSGDIAFRLRAPKILATQP
jgi:hypothetical protein